MLAALLAGHAKLLVKSGGIPEQSGHLAPRFLGILGFLKRPFFDGIHAGFGSDLALAFALRSPLSFVVVWDLLLANTPAFSPPQINSEALNMSAKKRRKIHGIRREFRRPRGWTRWYLDGLLDEGPMGGVRLCTTLWGTPGR